MLAACLDAAAGSTTPRLLPYIQFCLEQGLPALKGEFSLSAKRVWRSETGSIAANYLSVHSKYDHVAAPVPQRAVVDDNSHNHHHGADSGVEHSHAHSHHHDSRNSHAAAAAAAAAAHEAADASDHSHAQHHEEESTTTQDHSHSHGHDHSHDQVSSNDAGPLRNLPQIRKLLEDASLTYIPAWVKEKAIAAFTKLAEAEALTHGAASSDSVHFHEVGAVDSIVDTVGTCLALYCLGVTTISCSRLPLGEGTVWTDHGLLPVPAPATLRLLVDMPTCPGPPGITGELVTPTAAALLKVLTTTTMLSPSKIPGRPPCFTIRKVGIGAGTKDFVKHPNILRLLVGDQLVVDDRRSNKMLFYVILHD